MVTTIQKYVASDGTEFATQGEAEAHEMTLKTKEVVEAFIVSANYKKVQAGMARNMIPAFLAFQAGQKD